MPGSIAEDSFAAGGTSAKRDGMWIILQDWTQCSLACGGGTQTLQRQCIPPQNGGLKCEGEELLTRTCNTQQCEFPTGDKHGPKTIEKKPLLKIVQVSPRKQRFEPGVIKEGDLDWYREDIESPGD